MQKKSTAADLKLQRVAQENEAARQARAAEAQLRHEYTHKRMEIKVAVLCCLQPERRLGQLCLSKHCAGSLQHPEGLMLNCLPALQWLRCKSHRLKSL